ncbi:uncharacterized protein EI90DRAFT_3059184 [Cantharellus anzutake]|uniref:uncharacterized protein n=1 Tax=Cantharellus anzutake TaxID=1750568 RepID=UPI001903F460|nr:uncharacterized protein EI90DRAFT_3059184 [Cantharellus anzutake]KAF8330754.1 hypothetical protein EI90DRAFT_3059184 [Cantharellus anzutake]
MHALRRSLALSSRQAFLPTRVAIVPLALSQTRHFRRPEQTSFEDPERRGLYYHLVGATTNKELSSYAVSFLEEPPRNVSSPTILGILPAVSSEGEESQEAGLHDFQPNSKFLDILHDSIKVSLERDTDETIRAEAQQRGSGWMHVIDSRNVPALNRTGDADDIIGTVRVEDGKVIPSTYERMPSYRICTSDGLTTLSDGLASTLVGKLLETHRHERLEP